MNPEQNWHLVFTKPNCEKKIAQTLSHRGFETYCPQQNYVGSWQNSGNTSPKPLFPSWVFVRCNTSQLPGLAKCRGVSNILYWLGNPAVVSQEEINTIKFVLSRFKQINLLKTGLRKEGKVSLLRENEVIFPLPSLGYSLAVAAETEHMPELTGAKTVDMLANRRAQVKVRFSNFLRQLPTLLAARKTAL